MIGLYSVSVPPGVEHAGALNFNPFRTAVPFWGQATSNLSGLFPKRGCGYKGVKGVCGVSPNRSTAVRLERVLYLTCLKATSRPP